MRESLSIWAYNHEILAFVLGTSVVFGAILAAGFSLARASCHEAGEMTGRTVEWRVLSGCYIESDGRMVPVDRWINAEVDA